MGGHGLYSTAQDYVKFIRMWLNDGMGPAGALAWAGLANLYYWIDRANGLGGFWATQIFPFADPVSVPGYLDFEKAVYDHARIGQPA